MALLIKATLGPSKIAGIGLFATEFIPKDTKIWEFAPNLDLVLEDLSVFPRLLQDYLGTYCYMNRGRYILCADHTRFFNHAEEPSCRDDAEGECMYAVRDIEPGEELTTDYRTIGVTEEDLAFNYTCRGIP
jgi:SET domain-containing protein